MGLLILRPGRLVRVNEAGANEAIAMVHGRKFSIRDVEIERENGTVYVRLRLNCCHCASHLGLNCAISEEMCKLQGRYFTSGGSIFLYNSIMENGPQCLIVDEELFRVSYLSALIDIDYYCADSGKEKTIDANPNLLFQMRVGRK